MFNGVHGGSNEEAGIHHCLNGAPQRSNSGMRLAGASRLDKLLRRRFSLRGRGRRSWLGSMLGGGGSGLQPGQHVAPPVADTSASQLDAGRGFAGFNQAVEGPGG